MTNKDLKEARILGGKLQRTHEGEVVAGKLVRRNWEDGSAGVVASEDEKKITEHLTHPGSEDPCKEHEVSYD